MHSTSRCVVRHPNGGSKGKRRFVAIKRSLIRGRRAQGRRFLRVARETILASPSRGWAGIGAVEGLEDSVASRRRRPVNDHPRSPRPGPDLANFPSASMAPAKWGKLGPPGNVSGAAKHDRRLAPRAPARTDPAGQASRVIERFLPQLLCFVRLSTVRETRDCRGGCLRPKPNVVHRDGWNWCRFAL
jgi:hypothetical protein